MVGNDKGKQKKKQLVKSKIQGEETETKERYLLSLISNDWAKIESQEELEMCLNFYKILYGEMEQNKKNRSEDAVEHPFFKFLP